MEIAELEFGRDGAQRVPAVLSKAECAGLDRWGDPPRSGGAGTRRLLAQPWCRALAARLREHPLISRHVPPDYAAVQCTRFEKSASLNWLVTIHQDLSVPFAARIDAPGWSGWSEKEGGQWFAQPPDDLLAQLVAVRLHLDPCGPDDGPLRVVAGSHRHGRLDDDGARRLRADTGEVVCTAAPGDALLLRPLLLHASSKASGLSARRVLHFVFGPPQLPHGLRWPLSAAYAMLEEVDG